MKIVQLRVVDGHVYASSRDVERDFGRDHKNVLAIIEQTKVEIGLTLSQSWFRDDFYFDSYNRRQPCIDMTRDGWTLVVMGFTGRDAVAWKVAYILKFNEMEAKLGAGAKTKRLWDRERPDGEVVAFQGPAPPQQELPLQSRKPLQHDLFTGGRDKCADDANERHLNALIGETKKPHIWDWSCVWSEFIERDYFERFPEWPLEAKELWWKETNYNTMPAAPELREKIRALLQAHGLRERPLSGPDYDSDSD